MLLEHEADYALPFSAVFMDMSICIPIHLFSWHGVELGTEATLSFYYL
jgi:hypothetical protein